MLNSTNEDELKCEIKNDRDKHAIFAWSGVMIFVTITFFLILSYLSVYVTRMVWKTDKFLPIMLYMLCFSLLS